MSTDYINMNNDEKFFDRLRKQQPVKSQRDKSLEAKKSTVVSQDCTQVKSTSNEHKQNKLDNEKHISNNSDMPAECKRALVTLIRQGVVLSLQKSKLFATICRYQDKIRKHLANMYLKLVLDEKSGISFIARVDEEDIINNEVTNNNGTIEETVSLISRRTLSLYDTLLLLILRKYYQERETAGEQKVIIDIERLESHLTPFLPLTNNSKSDRKKLNAALKKMIEKRILTALQGSEDRYEITPIIRYVVNAEFLETMLVEYHKLAIDAKLEINTEIALEAR